MRGSTRALCVAAIIGAPGLWLETCCAVKPDEVKTPSDAARLISKDFCIKHGEEAIPRQILKERYMEAGMDPKYPDPAGIVKVVFLLEKVDRDLQGPDAA